MDLREGDSTPLRDLHPVPEFLGMQRLLSGLALLQELVEQRDRGLCGVRVGPAVGVLRSGGGGGEVWTRD